MTKYMGVEVEDFDPDDPHCFMCEEHLDPDLPIVILLLTRHSTGERKAVVSCLRCAVKDDDVRSILSGQPHTHAQHKDYLN